VDDQVPASQDPHSQDPLSELLRVAALQAGRAPPVSTPVQVWLQEMAQATGIPPVDGSKAVEPTEKTAGRRS
jgi:hypothetical protein